MIQQKLTVRQYADPQLVEFINSNARYLGLFAGRRFGKTKGGWFPRMTRRCLSEPINYMYVAPGYSLAKEMYEYTTSNLSPFIRRSVGQPKPAIYFWNGSMVDFRSFDKPKFIKGTGRHEVFFDEIQDCKDEAQFWRVLRPLISDKRGTIAVAGQFAGKNWYYKEFFEKGQDPQYRTHKSWRFPTWDGIMFRTESGKREIEEMRASMPAALFDVEIACIAAANQSAVFREDDLKAIMRGETRTGPSKDANNNRYHYIIGYDLGEMVDPSALVILEYETMTVVHAELIPLRVKHADQAHKLASLASTWNAQIIVDATGGGTGGKHSPEENIRFYRDQIPDLRAFIWHPQFKREMVKVLSLAVEQRRLSIPAALAPLHRELEAYEFEAKAEGSYDYHGPRGKGDNLVAALMMAVQAAKAGYIRDSGARPLASLMY